jgi:hypothetical protein
VDGDLLRYTAATGKWEPTLPGIVPKPLSNCVIANADQLAPADLFDLSAGLLCDIQNGGLLSVLGQDVVPTYSPTFKGPVSVANTLTVGQTITSYNGIATAGEGLSHIVYSGSTIVASGATAYTYDTGITTPGLYKASVFIYPNNVTTGTWTTQIYTATGGWNPLITTIGSFAFSAAGQAGSAVGVAYHGNSPAGVTLKIHLTSTVAGMAAVLWIVVEMLSTVGAF